MSDKLDAKDVIIFILIVVVLWVIIATPRSEDSRYEVRPNGLDLNL
jgi:hypothetical protein